MSIVTEKYFSPFRMLQFLILAGVTYLCATSSMRAATLSDKDAPLDWVYPDAEPLRFHVVRGLWSREYRLDEAMALAGAGSVTESWHAHGMGFGYVGAWDANVSGSVPEFPDTAENLLANHVLVICNINAKAFTQSQQTLIQEFIRNGGGVLFLGGRFAFGSQWAGSSLAEVAPVSFVGVGKDGEQAFDLKSTAKGLVLIAGPDRLGDKPSPLDWEQTPRVFWYHDVKPKSDSQVVLVADGNPLLVTGTYGKGRVALFAGSVMGEPPDGSLPFWQWNDWPHLMAEVMAWLAAPRNNLNSTLNASVQKQISATVASLNTSLEVDASEATLSAAEPLLCRVGKICRDADTLEQIVQAIAVCEADPSSALAEFIGRRAAAYPGPQAGRLAIALVASGSPGKTAIGLRLAGASRQAGSVDALIRHLASGAPATLADRIQARGDSLATDVISVVTPEQKEIAAALIRLAALEGLVLLGDATALPAIQKAIAESRPNGCFATLVGDRGVESYMITSDNRIYQTGLVAALACGDTSVASPLAEALLGNVYVASRARSGWNGPKKAASHVEGSLPSILAWQATLHAILRRCPVDRLESLAQAIAAIDDIRIVPSVCAAFGGRLTPAIRTALQTSKIKGVVSVGESR